MEENIKPAEDCLIGVGYNNCKDLGFLAKNLFAAMKPEINSLKDDLKGE